MKTYLIKSIASLIFLCGFLNNSDAGIIHSQKNSSSVNLEQIAKKMQEKYSNRKLEYFSRGFLQFSGGNFAEDLEIGKMIQDLNPDKEKTKTDPNYAVDGANFNYDNFVMIDSELHHIGDDNKTWMPIKSPEGTSYQKEFLLTNPKSLKKPRLGIEVFVSDSDNKVFLNDKFCGILPKMSKGKWGKLMKKHKENSPFFYGEIDISRFLKDGMNTLKIESAKSGMVFKNYDDFLIRWILIVYENE